MLICYLITPTINEAKDSMNQPMWTILHLTTIHTALDLYMEKESKTGD